MPAASARRAPLCAGLVTLMTLAPVVGAAGATAAFAATDSGALPALNVMGSPTDLALRRDPDGNSTAILLVEDEYGSYQYTRVVTPPATPDAREAGAFVNRFALASGAVAFSVGVYERSAALGRVIRLPLVVIEGVTDPDALVAAAQQAAQDAVQQGQHGLIYGIELALPDFQNYFAGGPSADFVSGFRDYPTVYVWNVRRTGLAGEVTAGHYLARVGSVTKDAAGRVVAAEKDAEIGEAARVQGATHRLAGAFLTQTIAYEKTTAQRQSVTYVAGLAAADGARAPLAAVRLDDDRSGGDLGARPAHASTGATVGVVANGAFVPLVGARTDQRYRPSENGYDVARLTSVGAYGPNGYVPAAGVRYHSDTEDVLVVATRAAFNGIGDASVGDFEIDAGPFAQGAFVPVAGLQYRSGFRDARHASNAMIAAGVHSPVGFAPLVAVTYDGTVPLTPWVQRWANGTVDGERFLIAAGTSVAGRFVPVVGVQGLGEAPLGERAEQSEFRVGVFAGSYQQFVPLASLAYDGDATIATHAAGLATLGGPGADVGAFDVRLGAYAADAYVPIAGAGYRSAHAGQYAAEGLVVAGVYGPNGFVPVAGVAYEGEEPLLGTVNAPTNVRDDQLSRFTVGAFVDGAFVPVVRVQNTGEDVRVGLLP